MKGHVSRIHKGYKPHKCEICGQTFASKPERVLHIEANHVEKKELECDVCKAKVLGKRALRHHMDYYHSGKIHKCHICDIELSGKQSLKNHVMTVHEGKKPFNCDLCNKNYTSKRYLKEHILIIHEEKKSYRLFCKELPKNS